MVGTWLNGTGFNSCIRQKAVHGNLPIWNCLVSAHSHKNWYKLYLQKYFPILTAIITRIPPVLLFFLFGSSGSTASNRSFIFSHSSAWPGPTERVNRSSFIQTVGRSWLDLTWRNPFGWTVSQWFTWSIGCTCSTWFDARYLRLAGDPFWADGRPAGGATTIITTF